jgi:hypothetical protein
MSEMTPQYAKQVSGSPMFAAMSELSEAGTYKQLDARFMAAHWWEVWDALLVTFARIGALEKRIALLQEHRGTFQCTKTAYRCQICDGLIAALAAHRPELLSGEEETAELKRLLSLAQANPDMVDPNLWNEQVDAALAAHRPEVLSGEEKP